MTDVYRHGYTVGLLGTGGAPTESALSTPSEGDVLEWWEDYQEGFEQGDQDRTDFNPLVIPIAQQTDEGLRNARLYIYMLSEVTEGKLLRCRTLKDGLLEPDNALGSIPLWVEVTEIRIPQVRQLVEQRFGITVTKEVA